MKATLKLKRDNYTKKSTQGKLYINDIYICETLEDVCRDLNRDGDLSDPSELKVYGETAIPSGIYKMIINISPKFKKLLPRLIGIVGFDGVLIHKGNIPADTYGCILVGMQRGVDSLLPGTSSPAFDKLMKELKKYDDYKIHIIDTL